MKKINIKFTNLLRVNNYWVVSDKKRLKQILINIIGNSVKFTNKGGIELKLENSSANILKFEIIDSGTGIK